MQIEALGDSALIIRLPQAPHEILKTLQALKAAKISGMIEFAPAYSTIAMFFDPVAIARDAGGVPPFEFLKSRIASLVAVKRDIAEISGGAVIEIPVCYESEFGLDLEVVAKKAGLDIAEVVHLHSNADYRVDCIGFTPGFPYLSGLPSRLATPRRSVPRKEVVAGSVAIGGTQTGIYPSKSPGGWNVIGRTPFRLFDIERDPPAIFRSGDHVRFREVTREQFEAFPR